MPSAFRPAAYSRRQPRSGGKHTRLRAGIAWSGGGFYALANGGGRGSRPMLSRRKKHCPAHCRRRADFGGGASASFLRALLGVARRHWGNADCAWCFAAAKIRREGYGDSCNLRPRAPGPAKGSARFSFGKAGLTLPPQKNRFLRQKTEAPIKAASVFWAMKPIYFRRCLWIFPGIALAYTPSFS